MTGSKIDFVLVSSLLRFNVWGFIPTKNLVSDAENRKRKNSCHSLVKKRGKKCIQHHVFPGGPPPEYYHGPVLVDFKELTGFGLFSTVWSYA